MDGQNGSSSNPSSFEPTIIGKNVSYKQPAVRTQHTASPCDCHGMETSHLVVNPVLHVVLEVQIALMDLLRLVLAQTYQRLRFIGDMAWADGLLWKEEASSF